MKNKILRNIAIGVITLASCLPFGCTSFNQAPKKSPAYEYTLSKGLEGKREQTSEKEFSKPKRELAVNYKTESEQEAVDYSSSLTWFNPYWQHLLRFPNSAIPELTQTENEQVHNLLNNIASYQELIDGSKNFSESQKLVLASVIGDSMKYDINLMYNEVMSQEESFENFQNEIAVGTCGHIHTHVERFLNDLGIKSAAVTGLSGNGVEHAYDISKTEKGTAILDYNSILTTNTKNIEKTLDAYQKNKGITAFQHVFFEDAEFEYNLITQDGRNFLDFIEYDESSEPLKNTLLQDFEPETIARMTLNLEDSLTFFEANLMGLFLKIGKTEGNASSPLEKAVLSQIGFKRKFLIPEIYNKYLNFIFGNKIIDVNVGVVNGEILQDKKINDNQVFGWGGNLIFSTNKQNGLNISSRIGRNIFRTKDALLFYDSVLGAGISYRFPIKNIAIEPYVTSQISTFLEDLGTQESAIKPSELVGGAVFDMKFNNSTFSIEPYYIKRIWEQGFGGKARFEAKKFGITSEGSILKSDYGFCPDKYKISVGSDLTLKNFTIRADYQIEGTNYDGEKEHQNSININGSIKF